MSGKHIIHRQVFAFDIPDEQSFPAYSRLISELQSSSLFEDLDRLLSEWIPEDLHIRIDRIELDVGVIGIDELGDILIRRILEALHRQLSSQRRGPSSARRVDVDAVTRDRRLLEYFVHHGRLPWWAPSQGTSIRQVAARLLRGDLGNLRALMESLRHDPVKIRRWLGHVDTKDLVPVWKQVHPAWSGLSDADALRLVETAIRLSAHATGRDAARDAIRYILLSDLLETERDPRTTAPDPGNPLSLLRKPTPFTSLSDVSQRFRTLHPREGRWERPDPDGRSYPSPGQSPRPGLPEKEPPPSSSVRADGRQAIHSDEIAEFRSFLLSGHLERYRSRSMLTELVRLFRGLVIDELPSLEDAIRDLGRRERVRRRILDNLSSPDIRFFFEQAVPDKKELLDWVSDVYLETQRKVRPINQTDIRVKRSVDEITLEIYTSTDLNAITNEAFLRMHLRRMALKHLLPYEDLLRRIVESVAMPQLRLSSRFIELLRKISAEDVLLVAGTAKARIRRVSRGEVAEGTLRESFRSAEDLTDQDTLRARLQTLARTDGIPYGQLLADVAASLDRPPLPGSAALRERLRRVIAQDMPGTASSMDDASVPGKAPLDPAVADVLRILDDRGVVPDLNTLRTRLKQYAVLGEIPYPQLLTRIASALKSPPLPASAILVDRLRKLTAERAYARTDGIASGQSYPDGPPDKALIEVLRMTDLTSITEESVLRARLRRIAAAEGFRYETLLGRLAARIADGEVEVPNRFSALLRTLHEKDAPDAGSQSAISRPARGTSEDGVADAFLQEVLSSREWAGMEDVASLRRHLHQVASRALIPYRELLTRLMDVQSENPSRMPSRLAGLLRQVHRADSPSQAKPSSEEAGRSTDRMGAGRAAQDPVTGEAGRDLRPTDRRAAAAETPAGEAPALRYVAEPVPDELLRLLTRDVMRALVLAKGTGIFGKSTRALQDLITAYIRLGGEVPTQGSVPSDELRRRLSEYLDLDASFLAFAMAYTARMHPEDGSARELSALLSPTQAPVAGAGRQLSEADVVALVRHIAEYRVYYEASHVKSLVLPALKGILIGREVFAAVMRLLFDEDASLVDATLHRILDRSAPLGSAAVSAATDELYRAFIVSALDVRNATFGLNRVFADVRRRLQPDREEPFVLPSRLSEVRMAFARDIPSPADRKGVRSQGVRENSIIRLYNILHLDLLLEDAGPRFFDNIPFSFELLLSRFRQQLLDILHVKRLDPELAHFFAYADRSRIFEQIRTLYPRTRVERVSRVFGHAVELLQRSRWLNLDREQSLAFGMLDSFAHVFSREDTEPVVSEVVLDILHRAAQARLLSRAFIDIFRDPDDEAVLRRLGRRLGRRRLERLLPSVAGSSAQRAEAIRQRIRMLRDILPEGPREARERDAYLSLSAILEAGTFPVGHPFEGQTLESQAAYIARMPLSGRVLARLLSDRPPRHPASVLLGAVDLPMLVSTVVQRFGVDRTTATRLFAFWSARAGVGGMKPVELMREVLLLRPVREEERGVEALRRSILTYLTASGGLTYWQALEYLPEEGVGPATPETRRFTLPAVAREGMSETGAADWYEFYFGVLTDTSTARSEGYRAVHAWAEYLFRHPAGRTRRRLLSLLQEAFLHAREGSGREAGRLHAGFLEVLRPFEGLRGTDARRVLRDLLDAGVPIDTLAVYVEGRTTKEGSSLTELLDAEQRSVTQPPRSAGGRLRGIPTPKRMLADLSRAGGPAGRVLTGLRRWVDGRVWTPSDTQRFADLLPPRAFEALLKGLAPSSDLPGIVAAWTEAFRETGWIPDARKARREVLGILFSGRLWRHRSTSAIHAAILAASGLPSALREGRLTSGPEGSGPPGIPPSLWRRLSEMPAGEEGASGLEDMSEAFALSMQQREIREPERPADASRPGAEVAKDDEAVAFFLETGRVPGLGRVAKASTEYIALVRRVTSMGVARFLSFRRLHASHEESVLEFFPAALVTRHILGVLARQASDPVLRDFLRSFEEEAVRTRVRLATLVRFLRLFRTRVGARPTLGNAGVDGFLEEALRIPGFEALVERVAQGMPGDAIRSTRSRFLRRSVREARRRSAQPAGHFDEAVWFFLRTGMLRASYGVDTIDQLAERLQERVRAGERVFREMLFTRTRDEAARRRVRRLLAGMEEREVYLFIHPLLEREMTELVRMMRLRFGVDVWRAVGARTDRDRIERVLKWWSATRSRPDAPMRILRLFMEEATAMLDARQLDRIRRPALGVMTASERELWAELRALLPDWLDTPPDEDRKLRKPVEKEGGPAMNDPEPAPDPAEGIPVRNGGLVLLWPYLGRLFSRLQLTDGKNFLGDRELSRAIRLTEYVVTGRTDMEEHQLALNKVLCGAPLDFEVPAELDVTPEEADLSLKMLQGAIRNWEKLKTTKPETFRETFLRREAIIYRVDERWELVVQRKPYDMLLDTLPWNITMIQLSWMPDRLVVQWK